MKKFNLICIVCMVLMLVNIVNIFMALDTGVYPIFYRCMLVIDGILFGMALGEFYLGNVMIKHGCDFSRKEETK